MTDAAQAAKPVSAEIIVSGHICLDVIPAIRGDRTGQGGAGIGNLLVPGKLVDVGEAVLATGGAVSNTGLALHRLGMPVRLMGKIGDDLFGQAILSIVRGYGEGLAEGMIVSPGEPSSYTVVISPPGVDRIFLHCTGANDTFSADDVDGNRLADARLFHFGYPPLMRRMYENDGLELAKTLASAKKRGLAVSLDMAKPDPDSPAGKADWKAILTRALPFVDAFLPSFEEILFMLRPSQYRDLSELHGHDGLLGQANAELLASLADEMLSMGAAIVGLKLGEHGLYVKTTADKTRLLDMARCFPSFAQIDSWLGRELLAPCYEVEVSGTTGAGDCTIAGFLTGLAKGLPVERTLLGAVGVGACNVERADAVSGVPAWDDVQRRIAAGWPTREPGIDLPGWTKNDEYGLWERIKR